MTSTERIFRRGLQEHLWLMSLAYLASLFAAGTKLTSNQAMTLRISRTPP